MVRPEQMQRFYKIYTSIPVSTLIYGGLFAFAMQASGNQPFSVLTFIALVIGFGLPMALIMRRMMKRNPTNPISAADWTLQAHVKSRTVPSDPALKKQYPAYLDRYEAQLLKSRKSQPLFLVVGAAGGLLGALDSNMFMIVCAVLIIFLYLKTKNMVSAMLANIDYLRAKKLHVK